MSFHYYNSISSQFMQYVVRGKEIKQIFFLFIYTACK